MSGECDYCGSYEHVEGGCPITKDPEKMWRHGYESGRINEANRQSAELTTLRQRAEAAEKRLAECEQEKARLVSAMTAESERLAMRVRELTPMRDDPVHDTHAQPKKTKDHVGDTTEMVLPPLEIADHAEALGWTEESRVWKDEGCGGGLTAFRVFPSAKIKWSDERDIHDSGETEDDCRGHGDTLLPNRRVPVEGKDETTKAPTKAPTKPATAWEESPFADEPPRHIAAMCRASASLGHAESIVKEWAADRERRAVEGALAAWKAAYPAKPAKPAKSAGEVADSELIDEAWTLLAQVGSLGGGWASQGSLWQQAAKAWRAKFTNRAAAIERERAPG